MNGKRRIISIACFLAAALLCAACAPAAAPGGGSQRENQTQFPITIENYGRQITLEEAPRKVVTAGPNCTELFIALGLEDLVVGNCCDNHSQGPLPEYAQAYENIPELTYGYPTKEAVAGSGADFIYAIDWVFGDDFSIEALEQLGITVYMCAATTYDEIWKEIEDLGLIFDAQEEARAFIESEKARVNAVMDIIGQREPIDVFVYDSGGDTIYTAGGPNIETLFIESAGGRNIFDDLDKAWIGVSYEEVLARNPQVMIIHDYDVPTAQEKIADILADPILSQLDCVKNQRFVILSLECALPGSRTAYCVETIAKGCYPQSDIP